MNPPLETFNKHQRAAIYAFDYQHLVGKLTFNQMLIRAYFMDKIIRKKYFLREAKKNILKEMK